MFSTAELQEAIQQSRREVFRNAIPQQHPVGVVLGGQPASGKSLLISRIQDDRPNTPFVVINGDEFRQFHPRFREINAAGDRSAAHQTQALANHIGSTLLAEAIDRRYNVIIEGTMRNPEVPASTAQRFRQAGYQAEAHVLAVNFYQSLQGVYLRYEQLKANGDSGRFSPLDVHREAYDKLPKTVDRLYERSEVDRLCLYDRGGRTLLADYQLKADGWSSPILPSFPIDGTGKKQSLDA